jgi:hypothetical protein
MARSPLIPVWIETPLGRPYRAWKVQVHGMTLILTTAELNRAQQRGRDYARDVPGRVARQSVAREVEAFERQYPREESPRGRELTGGSPRA